MLSNLPSTFGLILFQSNERDCFTGAAVEEVDITEHIIQIGIAPFYCPLSLTPHVAALFNEEYAVDLLYLVILQHHPVQIGINSAPSTKIVT